MKPSFIAKENECTPRFCSMLPYRHQFTKLHGQYLIVRLPQLFLMDKNEAVLFHFVLKTDMTIFCANRTNDFVLYVPSLAPI